ncbi:MAG: Gfo/Idh/MocA family oxidoreductase [Chloroflexota bacterium]|nr:Gfo/Idh/MocA family oxidoreductase [Chloroflexota bacterium]
MSRPTVGVVGAGFMGDTHLEAWRAEGVPAVSYDIHPERAAAIAARHGVPAASSLDDLISGADIVDVCTSTHRHREVVERAAAAGRHVICEKPLARSVRDGEAMLAACARAGVRLFVAHVVRYFPEYAAAHAAVRAGEVGAPGVLRLKRASFRPRHAAGHWFFDSAKSGGIVLDLMIHDFDYARWVAGDVVSVQCRSADVERPGLALDHAFAILRHRDGAISHVTGSWAYPFPMFRTAVEIAGSHGLLEFDSEKARPLRAYLHERQEEPGSVGLPRSPVAESPYRLELREFLRAATSGGATRVSAEDGLAALRIALAAEQSARTGSVARVVEAA